MVHDVRYITCATQARVCSDVGDKSQWLVRKMATVRSCALFRFLGLKLKTPKARRVCLPSSTPSSTSRCAPAPRREGVPRAPRCSSKEPVFVWSRWFCDSCASIAVWTTVRRTSRRTHAKATPPSTPRKPLGQDPDAGSLFISIANTARGLATLLCHPFPSFVFNLHTATSDRSMHCNYV